MNSELLKEKEYSKSNILVNTSNRMKKSQSAKTEKKKNELINDMNKLYRGYYYSLLANGYNPVSEPVVDTRLIGHCYEKEWLLPIAHIILIRDAQYQMMGELKYKKEELLTSTVSKNIAKIDKLNEEIDKLK